MEKTPFDMNAKFILIYMINRSKENKLKFIHSHKCIKFLGNIENNFSKNKISKEPESCLYNYTKINF